MHQTSFTLPHPTPQSTPQVSETPSGPLNQFTTSRSFGSRFTATIPPHDLQSFTTDIQQPWLTQPPSTRLQTHTPSHERTPQADFVLFPSPTDSRPVRRQTGLVRETSSIPRNYRLASNQIQLNQRRNSTQQTQSPSSASPFQNPRVRNSIQGTGSSTSSPRFRPNGNLKQQQHNFYASSAPSSTSALHVNKSRTRPPVPLFTSNSTGSLANETHTMAVSDSPNGIDSPSLHNTVRGALTLTTTDLAHDFFDFSSEPFNEDESSPDQQIFQDTTVQEMDYTINFSSPMFNPINGVASGQPSEMPQTVSPRDVFIDSNPSSSVTTNMTTPASLWNDTPLSQLLDSPAIFSNNNSPWNDELDIENQHFPSLFPVDNTPVDDGLFPEHTVHQSIEAMGPPRMTRIKSSPGSSTSQGASHSRHSSTAGVRTRKRNHPLPLIPLPDAASPTVVKRARNTLAARKSREKKVQRLEELTTTVEMLQQRNVALENEVTYWRDLAEGKHQFGQ